MFDAKASQPATSPVTGVTPRRPVRPAAQRSLPRVEWQARPDSVENLFSDIYGHLAAPAAPPATARERGRARVRALVSAREIAAAPTLHNLWHDAFVEPAAPPANAPVTTDATADSQTDEYARIRAALYDLDDTPTDDHRAQPQSVPMRLAVYAMNGTLMVVAAPVGAAVLTYSLLRGEDLRLTGNALAVCGSLMALIQTGLHWV